MDKKEVWRKIKMRDYDIPSIEHIFRLIENHFDRVEFVKDHLGLKDFMFIAESGTEKGFLSNLFLALNVETTIEDTLENKEIAFRRKMVTEYEIVFQHIRRFFLETKRTMYIGIGFVETMTSPVDEIVLSLALRDGKIKSIHEGMRKIRRFPTWYGSYAKMPEQILVNSKNEESKTIKNQKEKVIKIIKNEIELLLSKKETDKTDRERFEQLSRMYCDVKKMS